MSPQKLNELVGKRLKRNVGEEEYFYESDIVENKLKIKNYKFSRPWGVPVRYHDYKDFHNLLRPDLWEFHLSYSDMKLDPMSFITMDKNVDFVVHAPELFENSHLMDLASPDIQYRKKSILYTQEVIEITKNLNTFFPRTIKPLIVANIGGFSINKPLKKEDKYDYYLRFEESLNKLDLNDVELIPQTMAPFPWHFGGQRFQNLFVEIEEILFWSKKLNLRMCLDISHSFLTSNQFKFDFYDFCKNICPIVAHIHIGDAKGLNGEGLQIGDGDINFEKLNKLLNKFCPKASFIPEIWQGHKNLGEGFWKALNILKKKL